MFDNLEHVNEPLTEGETEKLDKDSPINGKVVM